MATPTPTIPATVGTFQIARRFEGPKVTTVTGMATPTPTIPVTVDIFHIARGSKGPKVTTVTGMASTQPTPKKKKKVTKKKKKKSKNKTPPIKKGATLVAVYHDVLFTRVSRASASSYIPLNVVKPTGLYVRRKHVHAWHASQRLAQALSLIESRG